MNNKWLSVATIFLGSFLVFGVQPMVGRTLLPVFGGTSAVWVVCLCAFQVLLLAGYWVAHAMAREDRLAGRLKIHVGLLLLSAVWTAFVAFAKGSLLALAGGGAAPALQVLLCVTTLVGLPYVLLGANASLVQALAGGEYRLYAVSNAGSLAGLLAYPFVFEPFVGLTSQWAGFATGIAAYAGLLWQCGRKGFTSNQQSGHLKDTGVSDPVPERDVSQSNTRHQSTILWFALPAASCFLLNALTSHVTLDIMPMPLIWTASLSLFLLSYIIGFSGRGERFVRPCAWATLVAFLLLCWLSGHDTRKVSPFAAAGACGAFLLAACTFLHSWLYRARPASEGLTRYYLLQSLGGAAGGVAASLAFPFICKTLLEYPVSLFGVAGLAVAAIGCAGARPSRIVGSVVALVLLVLGGWMYWTGIGKETRPVVYRGRGFFGTIEVLEAKAKTATGEGCIREFVHGTTVHGIQANLPGKTRMPTTYYTPDASGYAICGHPKYRKGEPMRVNVTGLGVGVLFSYGRTNDYYRAYEISEDALRVATDTNLFTFVSECPAHKEIVLGDARKGLEAELAAGVEPYDVIVVDAFTGDNLPYHLSTREAFDLYFKLLKPDGILCVNISNWHLTLEPFMRAVGDAYNVPMMGLETRDDYARLAFGAKVAFFCREPGGMAPPPVDNGRARMIDFSRCRPMARLPTDEKGSFIELVKW